MKSPVKLLASLLIDFRRLHTGVQGLDRDFHTIKRRFKAEGFSFLSKTLPTLCDAIIDGTVTGQFACPRAFSKIPKKSIPKFLSGMTSEIFDTDTGLLLENHSVEMILSLRQLLLLFKKTVTTDAESDELEAKAASSFFDVEELIVPIKWDPKFEFVVERISCYILPNLNCDLDSIDMRHGPGAVFEPVKGNQKWKLLCETVLGCGSLDSYGYDMFAINERLFSSQPFMGEHANSRELFGSSTVASSSIARLVTVPKSSTSRRTITVEPMMNQFVQQGLKAHLRKSIRKCSILSQCIAITDQTLNQKLALEGSIHDTYATIDLKSASDLLSCELVEKVFGSHGLFLDHAFDCRSQYVTFKDRMMRIKKFAGMGNALTFPVQSVVFAVLSIAQTLIQNGEFPTYRNVKRAARRVRVYGDDIIVESKYARSVVSGLESVGLIVNTSKSFLNGNFKESCGTDYYKGVLVTPLYIRYHPDNISKENRALSNLVEVSNQAWLRGLYSFSTRVRELVEDFTGPLPLVHSRSSALGWRTRQEAYEFQKWDPKLHKFLVFGPVIRSRQKRDLLDGYPALLKFFLTPRLFEDEEVSFYDEPMERRDGHLSRSPVRYRTAVKWRWVAAA